MTGFARLLIIIGVLVACSADEVHKGNSAAEVSSPTDVPDVTQQPATDADGMVNDSPTPPDLSVMSAEELAAKRRKDWARTYSGTIDPRDKWEAMFDGSDSPADSGDAQIPNHMRWCNPVDDDYGQILPSAKASLIKLNHEDVNVPKRGFYHVDRISQPENKGRTGNIFRRETYFDDSTGLTIEARLKIFKGSNENAYLIKQEYRTKDGDQGIIGVFISPNKIQLGSTRPFPTQRGNHYAIDALRYNFYRIVKHPGKPDYDVYVNGTLRLRGKATIIKDGAFAYVYPLLYLGDPSNDPQINSKYTLDYVAYSRGVFPPGVPVRARPAVPPPLPPAAEPYERWAKTINSLNVLNDQSFIYGSPTHVNQLQIDGRIITMKGYNKLVFSNQHENSLAVKLRSTKIKENAIAAGKPLTDAEIRAVLAKTKRAPHKQPFPGLAQQGAATIELRAQLKKDSEEYGFKLNFKDELGEVSLILSPDKVQLGRFKYGGVGLSAPIKMDTTDKMHVYRLVRKAKDMLAYLYIDNNPVPAVWDYHIGGGHSIYRSPTSSDPKEDELHFFTQIWLGYAAPPITNRKLHAKIDYLRWHGRAWAPKSN